MKTKRALKRKRGRLLRSTAIVSLREYAVPDKAKRELVDIWLAHDGNEAKQILEAFKLGFNTGATAQANDKVSDSRE